jgi:hypothetical protein
LRAIQNAPAPAAISSTTAAIQGQGRRGRGGGASGFAAVGAAQVRGSKDGSDGPRSMMPNDSDGSPQQ